MTKLARTMAPFEAGRARLQEDLIGRHEAYLRLGGKPLPAPLVVPLGAGDTLRGKRGDAHAAQRPQANVHLASRAVLIGPWHKTNSQLACGTCLAMRWQRLRSRSEREALELGYEPNGAAGWPVLADYALDAAWSTYCAVLGEPRPAASPAAADQEMSQVTRLDLSTLALATFPLLPEPLCPHCVRPRPDTAESEAMRPTSRPKPDPDAYRLRPLGSFPLPTMALANPVCGALGSGTWLNPASTTTAPVAGSNFVRGYAGLNDVTWSGQANSYATSRKLAYLEGLERYAGTHRRRGTTPVNDSFQQLRNLHGDAVLNPAECGFYAPETYRTDPLVSPFNPNRSIPWVWGHSLRDDRPVLVPARLVHYSAGVKADNFVFECSNGCATGGSLEEAILFGLLELIERDAFLLGWYGRSQLTAIDLDSCGSISIRTMVDRAALHGYDVHAFDNRIDLAVPVVTALAVRRDGGPGTLAFSAAAGFDPENTVDAALSEVLTYIPHLPYQVAERRAELEAMAEDFGKVRHLKDHAQLYGLPVMAQHAREYLTPAAVVPFAEAFANWEVERPRNDDLLDDLRFLRDDLVRCGYDVIAVDQTTPEQQWMGLRTVSTIVPGLLPLDFGWSRQRALRMPRLRAVLGAIGGTKPKEVPHPFP
ncbi:TOMM precursor leader peptide-binding protein [Streptomyces chartreusis]|uniref:TOMM precursor leader peptide-binding protein n=1 Tax=Streptomyces chartreusis TaxID=1969 RepID=UPI0036BBA1CB